LLWGYQSLAESRSNRKIAEVIQALKPVPDAIYTVDTIPESLPFYLSRPVTLVAKEGELVMGIEAEPEKWIETLGKFKQQWEGLQNGVAVIDKSHYDKYVQMGIPMVIVYRGHKRMVVTRR